MQSYYSEKLSGQRLKLCYDIAPPRVQTYLEAEIQYLLDSIRPGDRILELGCGYGRVLARLAPAATLLVGIDLSFESLRLASDYLRDYTNVALAQMNAVALGFSDGVFDIVCCPQNGIAVFQIDQRDLTLSALRVTRPGGKLLFFSYSDRFWNDRLDWFRLQAAYGLVGEIDETATRNGTIVCRDGFKATTVTPQRFAELTDGLGREVQIRTLADSSLLCEITA